MSLILVITFFALEVNIYLQNMFAEIRPKRPVSSLLSVVVCSLSHSIIDYACPNLRSKCAMGLQHEFVLSTHPEIPANGHVGGLCYFLFYYNSPKLLSCFFFQQNMLNLKFLQSSICNSGERVEVFSFISYSHQAHEPISTLT